MALMVDGRGGAIVVVMGIHCHWNQFLSRKNIGDGGGIIGIEIGFDFGFLS